MFQSLHYDIESSIGVIYTISRECEREKCPVLQGIRTGHFNQRVMADILQRRVHLLYGFLQ